MYCCRGSQRKRVGLQIPHLARNLQWVTEYRTLSRATKMLFVRLGEIRLGIGCIIGWNEQAFILVDPGWKLHRLNFAWLVVWRIVISMFRERSKIGLGDYWRSNISQVLFASPCVCCALLCKWEIILKATRAISYNCSVHAVPVGANPEYIFVCHLGGNQIHPQIILILTAQIQSQIWGWLIYQQSL